MAYDAVRGAQALAKFKRLGLKSPALPDVAAEPRAARAHSAPRPEAYAVDPLIRQPKAVQADAAEPVPPVEAKAVSTVSTARRSRRKLKDIPAAPAAAQAEEAEPAPEPVEFRDPPEDPGAEAPGEFDKDPLLDRP